MNNRIDFNLNRNIGLQTEHLRRTEPPSVVNPLTATSSNNPARPAKSVEEVRNQLLLSHRKASVAIGAITQLKDLVIQVKERLEEPQTRQSHLAQERLVQSARDTARDIIVHARTDAGPLFGQTTQTPAASLNRNALNAYTRNAATYALDTSADPPGLRHALNYAITNLNGNNGILVRLDEIEATSERAPHQLQDVADTLQTVGSRFQFALDEEINPALNPTQPKIPYDLAG